MMICELCGARVLLAFAVDDCDRLLYMRSRCEHCGHNICDYGDANSQVDNWLAHPLTEQGFYGNFGGSGGGDADARVLCEPYLPGFEGELPVEGSHE